MFVLLIAFSVIICLGTLMYYQPFAENKNAIEVQKYESDRRQLSSKYDLITGESVVTYNGITPQTKCPLGFYRPDGATKLKQVTGQRTDGCIQCPLGRYGASQTLKSELCTAACPAGKYGSEKGLKSEDECQYCPPGTYGSSTGLTTDSCTASCPSGKYSSTYGNSKASGCKSCPTGYRGWQCTGAILPRPN